MIFLVVIDTACFISGVLSSRGSSFQVLEAWRSEQFINITSDYILREVREVLGRPSVKKRHKLTDEEIEGTVSVLDKYSLKVELRQVDPASRDPKDDPVIATAREGGASYIVTWDRDLLDIGEYQGIRILTPKEFLKVLQGKKKE